MRWLTYLDIMELVAFGSTITEVLFLIVYYESDLGVILPILSVYALAGVKLLPAFQSIYTCIAKIRASTPAFESIQDDLINSKKTKSNYVKENNTFLVPKKQISLENISFKYPNKNDLVINNVNISIPVNSIVGLVGPSGSGKSTLIVILLGLIDLTKEACNLMIRL